MVNKDEYKEFVKNIIEKGDKDIDLSSKLKKLSKKNSLGILFGVLFVFFGVQLTIVETTFIIGIILLLVGIFLFVSGIITAINKHSINKYLSNNYKNEIIDFLLKDVGYIYNKDYIIDSKIFDDSQFVSYYDKYEGEDYLSINIPNDDGSKSSNYLTVCDITVKDIDYDNEGKRHERILYDGAFGYSHFPFEFKCALCINTSYKKKGLKLQKVNLEDISFNKKFSIKSNDQIEARYILTPKMMENLLFLNEKLKGLKITLIDDKMYIGFRGNNLFEFRKVKNDNIFTVFENFYDEIDVLLKIVNEIKNNNKVFKI